MWHVGGNRRGVYTVWGGGTEEVGPLGRRRRRWENNIKMNLREVGWGNMNWTDVASDREVGRRL